MMPKNQNSCNENGSIAKFGKPFNNLRSKYGAPIIHDYLCFETATDKMETWGLSKEIQDTITAGFHEGKGVFLKTDGLLDEKDIFRKRINDSTFIMLGILTYVSKDMKVEFTNIWSDTVSARTIGLARTSQTNFERVDNPRQNLTIQEADSILQSWGTSRFK
jgi:hypothetical protein